MNSRAREGSTTRKGPNPVDQAPEDVRTTLPDDLDADATLSLAPLDPETEAARRRIREAATPTFPPASRAPAPKPRLQFSIAQLLVANTILAFLLGLMQLLAPHWVAGALGIVAFSVWLSVTLYEPDDASAYTIAWSLIAVYIVVALLALSTG